MNKIKKTNKTKIILGTIGTLGAIATIVTIPVVVTQQNSTNSTISNNLISENKLSNITKAESKINPDYNGFAAISSSTNDLATTNDQLQVRPESFISYGSQNNQIAAQRFVDYFNNNPILEVNNAGSKVSNLDVSPQNISQYINYPTIPNGLKVDWGWIWYNFGEQASGYVYFRLKVTGQNANNQQFEIFSNPITVKGFQNTQEEMRNYISQLNQNSKNFTLTNLAKEQQPPANLTIEDLPKYVNGLPSLPKGLIVSLENLYNYQNGTIVVIINVSSQNGQFQQTSQPIILSGFLTIEQAAKRFVTYFNNHFILKVNEAGSKISNIGVTPENISQYINYPAVPKGVNVNWGLNWINLGQKASGYVYFRLEVTGENANNQPFNIKSFLITVEGFNNQLKIDVNNYINQVNQNSKNFALTNLAKEQLPPANLTIEELPKYVNNLVPIPNTIKVSIKNWYNSQNGTIAIMFTAESKNGQFKESSKLIVLSGFDIIQKSMAILNVLFLFLARESF